jgi:hypothetical protein
MNRKRDRLEVSFIKTFVSYVSEEEDLIYFICDDLERENRDHYSTEDLELEAKTIIDNAKMNSLSTIELIRNVLESVARTYNSSVEYTVKREENDWLIIFKIGEE